MSRRPILAFTFVALPHATAIGAMQSARAGTDQVRPSANAQPRAKASQSGLDLSGLNRTIDPCTDFNHGTPTVRAAACRVR
jgi:hypothetical protein